MARWRHAVELAMTDEEIDTFEGPFRGSRTEPASRRCCYIPGAEGTNPATGGTPGRRHHPPKHSLVPSSDRRCLSSRREIRASVDGRRRRIAHNAPSSP